MVTLILREFRPNIIVSLNESTELAYQAGHFILENNNTEDDVFLYSASQSK